MDIPFKVNPKEEIVSLKGVIDQVRNGYNFQLELSAENSNIDALKYNDAIIVAPDYQREYRSSVSDESSLIESLLLEIPIPAIFLASHKLKGVQVLNVVDGQHRLRAVYRYLTNEFQLQGLTIWKELNGLSFDQLHQDIKVELLSRRLSMIIFRNFPGKNFELEVFNRYNKGTKPLTAQDIRHAVYDSPENRMVNAFCEKLMRRDSVSVEVLSEAYAISKDRYVKKTIHENIFVILSIIEDGVRQNVQLDNGDFLTLTKSPQYAEYYMKKKAECFKAELSSEDSSSARDILGGFNDFIIRLCRVTPFPFSREIYGVSSSRGNKFQVSISMALAGIYKYLLDNKFDFSQLEDPELYEVFTGFISSALVNSHLEKDDYKASSTNPFEIQKIVDNFIISCDSIFFSDEDES